MARKARASLAKASTVSSRASSRVAVSRHSVISTPAPLPTRSRRALTRSVVANSSSDVEELLVTEETSNIYKAVKTRQLAAVVVPARRSTMVMQDSDASSVSSLTGSSNVDIAYEEYETPATSKSMTPTGTTNVKNKIKGVNITGKRKRSNLVVANTTNDEEFALALQEEEYGSESEPKSRKPTKFIIDSEDEDVEATIESSEEEPLAGPSKRARLSNTPRRKAASTAVKTISERAARVALKIEKGVLDSEDEGLSSVGDFVDDDDESDFNEDAASKADPASRATSESSLTSLASLQTATAVAAPQRTDRRRNAARANARRMHQHRMRRMLERKERRRLKLETAHPEIKTMWDDLEAVEVLKPIPAEQPASINRKLKSFQLEGLNWMIRQEKTHYRGGLLGDEMGMGKTIQAVSLIMSDFPAKQPTLVVVPPVALMQWQNEIRDYTDGKLNVLVIHQSNAKSKNLSLKELKKFNVLLISYNSLESMYRKEVKGWSRGEDIVKEDSPIHAIQFHRLILDEAHSIKTRTTGVAKACFALKGTYKWCLSGTPVQNRIGEFFSLLRFLEVRPFADYFCEKCDCAQLHWSLNEDYKCDHCGHSGAEHRSVFNEELLNPITGDEVWKREEAMDKLHLITARVMLRRMKRDYTSSMELPPKEIVIHNEFFGEIERDFSKSIMTNSSRKFDTYVSQGVMLNNYANIFGLIMQMRQVANHPDLLLKKHAEGGQNILVCQICDEPAEEAIRSRCHHEFCRSCVKSYVQSCEGAGSDADCPRCHIPLSIDWEQPDIEQDEEMVKKSSIINRIKMENWTSSTKIEMLVYDLYKLRSKKQTLKSIVFSQFTSMLQLIEWRLRRAGFNTVMLDGSMTPIQRQRSIDYFMKNTNVEVFLVSLKAGGVALNLTEASRVFIVDPWWNPAAEWQSADRCHRIGQKRPCVITRLCIEDSVESRMVMLQEKKASMISASINNDKVAMEKLSPEDLQFLFRGT